MARGNEAKINPEVLLYFRQKLTIEREIVAKKVWVKIEKIEEWEKWESFPTFNQCKKLGKVFNSHFSFFYLSEPPAKYVPKNINYRWILLTLEDNERYNLQMNLIWGQRRQDMFKEIYEILEMKPEKKRIKIKLWDDVVSTAVKIREMLGVDKTYISKLSSKPSELINYWKALVENTGIMVSQTISHLSLDTKVMRGFCITDDLFPIVVLNSKDTVNGKIFTLLHELCHILLWGKSELNNIDFRDANYNNLDKEEIYCNKLSAEILVPQEKLEILINEWLSNKDIAKAFWSSIDVIVRRKYDLGNISKSSYIAFLSARKKEFEEIQKLQKNRKIIVEHKYKVINNNGKLYTKTVLEALNSNKISILSASNFLNAGVKHITSIENAIYK